MMHSWVGRPGPTNPSNKDDWWISDDLKPNSGTQHINKLSDRVVKNKDKICKNTHDKFTGKNKRLAQSQIWCHKRNPNVFMAKTWFPNEHALNGPLPVPGTPLPLQTGSLKTTYPQDFKDPGDDRDSGRVQTCV